MNDWKAVGYIDYSITKSLNGKQSFLDNPDEG